MLKENADKLNKYELIHSRVKYTIITYFKERLGMITCKEVMIEYDRGKMNV